MSIAEKLTIIAENEQRVYDSGYSKAESDIDLWLWNSITSKGSRKNYARAFNTTDFSGYTFVKPITPTGLIYQIFYDYTGKYLPNNIDFSKVPQSELDKTSSGGGMAQVFSYAVYLLEVPYLGWKTPKAYYQTFAYSRKAVTIEKIPVMKETTFSNTFTQCSSLKEVTFEGEIGNNISFADCSELTTESMNNIVGCLYDFVGNGETTTKTLTVHADVYARTPEELKEEARGKGWSIVSA